MNSDWQSVDAPRVFAGTVIIASSWAEQRIDLTLAITDNYRM